MGVALAFLRAVFLSFFLSRESVMRAWRAAVAVTMSVSMGMVLLMIIVVVRNAFLS
jgi:hypothetical protein